jgi:aminoglycoside phosphotransferase
MTEAKEGIRAMSYRNNKYELIRYIQSHKKRFLDLLNAVLREIFNKNPIKCAFNQEHEKRINKLLNN